MTIPKTIRYQGQLYRRAVSEQVVKLEREFYDATTKLFDACKQLGTPRDLAPSQLSKGWPARMSRLYTSFFVRPQTPDRAKTLGDFRRLVVALGYRASTKRGIVSFGRFPGWEGMAALGDSLRVELSYYDAVLGDDRS